MEPTSPFTRKRVCNYECVAIVPVFFLAILLNRSLV